MIFIGDTTTELYYNSSGDTTSMDGKTQKYAVLNRPM